ncbi:hypothetical protein ANANG_G00253060 [Anguilla anguilla]|uniref:Uncharacterized protein n=1 Tax=Anguilla anguilla TaxID=7936 RepID=A0A9D3RMP3_ANGAN|nr:hypothetical protein ANANG_G00253060 [Anguilla anguilla]
MQGWPSSLRAPQGPRARPPVKAGPRERRRGYKNGTRLPGRNPHPAAPSSGVRALPGFEARIAARTERAQVGPARRGRRPLAPGAAQRGLTRLHPSPAAASRALTSSE